MANVQQDQSGQGWTAQSGYTKPARPEWGQASWYQQHIPSQLAKGQANQLGISTDQMYQIYAQQGLGPSAIGQGAGAWSNPNQGSGAGGGGQWIPSTPGVISGVQQAEQAHSIGNILWPQPVQQTQPPPPAPTGQTGTSMNPLQLPSQQVIQQTPQVPQQVPQQQAVAQAPQQQPIMQNVLNPIPVQVQPVQQYGNGGLVQRYQSGGMVQNDGQVQQIAPGVTRNAQGQVVYTDPALQTQLGLGDLTTSQQTSLGLDPFHSQAMSGATQVGAQYAPYFLGAAALNMPAVINLPPSGTPSSKSGVAPTPGAIVGNAVPQTPQGPWLTNPSIFARATPYTPTAAPTVTPQTPATSVPYAPGQAFATPPAQPGYTLGTTAPPTPSIQPRLPAGFGPSPQGMGYVPQGWQQAGAGPPPPAPVSGPVALQAGAPPQAFLQAHTSALANAGMAMYAHFGGDPKSASPEDIANFHTQLTNAVGQHIAGAGPSAAGAKKMAAGGYVPGYDRGGSIQDPEYAGIGPWEASEYGVGNYYPQTLPQPYISPTNQAALAAQAQGSPVTPSEVPTKLSSTTTAETPSKTTTTTQTTQPKKSAGGGRRRQSDPDPDAPYLRAASGAAATRPGDPDPDAPYLRAAAAIPATGGAQPVQSATVVTPYPTTGLAPGETGYVTSGEPNWLQRAGQTIGHFFTGTLGQDPYQRGTWQYAPRMDSGGSVGAPEAQHQTLTTQSGTGNAPATGQPSGQPSSRSAQTSSPQVGGGSNLFSGLAQAAHTYGNSLSNIGSGGPGSIDKLGYLGDEPIIGQMGITGGGGMSSGLKSALGGIGSGLTQAAQAIASSVQPWQMQSYQNPYGSGIAPAPQIQMQPERVA